MIKPTIDDNTTYIICECSTRPEDISMDIINESTEMGPNGNMVNVVTIDTTLQSFDVENWNKRIYDGELVMSSIDNDGMIQNDIKRGQWIGEFGHPLDLTPRRQMILHPPTSSHRILNYRRVGNLLKGHVRTLPYGYGLSMAANAKDGVPSSFSLRSLGSVDLATRRVKRPLKVITYDSVYRPSHIEAYQDAILNEAVGIYIPSDNNIETILTECAVFEPLHESFRIEDVEKFVKERSDNIQIIADMFKLDSFNATLNESGTRANVVSILDETTTLKVSVPIEKVINMQYADILDLRNRNR